MKFSIISCSRNNSKWLLKNIESVQNQTFKDYEHILIDDASDDNSVEILKSISNKSKMKVYVRKNRSYALKNHILGLKKASGDIIIHLDGDDWFYDNNVLDYVNSVYEKNNCLATYGSWVDVANPNIINSYKHPTHKALDVRRGPQWYFTHLRTFKRELCAAINGMDLFDDDGMTNDIGADSALLTSIYEYAMLTGNVQFIDKPLVWYNSKTGDNDSTVNLNKQINTSNSVLNSKYSICNIWK